MKRYYKELLKECIKNNEPFIVNNPKIGKTYLNHYGYMNFYEKIIFKTIDFLNYDVISFLGTFSILENELGIKFLAKFEHNLCFDNISNIQIINDYEITKSIKRGMYTKDWKYDFNSIYEIYDIGDLNNKIKEKIFEQKTNNYQIENVLKKINLNSDIKLISSSNVLFYK
jgi:hypothetical protein